MSELSELEQAVVEAADEYDRMLDAATFARQEGDAETRDTARVVVRETLMSLRRAVGRLRAAQAVTP